MLQLRTYAAAGRAKILVYTFIILDVGVIASLVTLGVIRRPPQSNFGLPYTNNYLGEAYDPFVWMPLAPLEFITLAINLFLALRTCLAYRKDKIGVSRLMVVILRDNICYLTL